MSIMPEPVYLCGAIAFTAFINISQSSHLTETLLRIILLFTCAFCVQLFTALNSPLEGRRKNLLSWVSEGNSKHAPCLIFILVFYAERDEVGTTLCSHVGVVIVEPPPHHHHLPPGWPPILIPPPTGWFSPGPALHCHVTTSYDHVMDGRGRSAFTLTKRACHQQDRHCGNRDLGRGKPLWTRFHS